MASRLTDPEKLKFTQTESNVRVIERDGIFRVFVGQLESVVAARSLKERMRGVIPPDSFITRP